MRIMDYVRKALFICIMILPVISFSNLCISNVLADSQEVSQDLVTSEALSTYLPVIMREYLPQVESIFGVDVGTVYPSGDLQAMRKAGAYWLRHDVRWEDVQPTGPEEWNWAALANLENQLLYAQEYDMQLILFVHGTPTWARKAGYEAYTCGAIAAEYLPNFGNFLYEIVSRYSSPPYNVMYWELYNEPDIAPGGLLPLDSEYGCWGDAAAPYYGGSFYADMLAAVYPRIKEANSETEVLVGGLLLDCDPVGINGCENSTDKLSPSFFEGILRHNGANDGSNYFDGVSFHAYDYYLGKLGQYWNSNWNSSWNTTGPVSLAKASYIRSLLANPDFGAENKYLINTEAALICGGMDDPPGEGSCDDDPTSNFELTKAYYLIQAFTTAIADNLEGNIWYGALGWRNSGLLYGDYSPRPAYYAYKTLRSELVNANFNRRITEYSGVSVYEFTRAGKKIWVVWSLDGNNHAVPLPSTPSKVVDALGNSVTPGNPMEITIKPLILDF